MKISFLLTIIIALCAVSLVFLLFPKHTPKALKNKKTPRPSPAPGKSSRKLEETQKQLSEAEAIREAVQAFVTKDPEATAKILKSWIKKK